MTDVSSERSILYDLDGLAMVRSRVRLPELESFRTELARDPDLVIEVSAAVKGTPAAEPWPSYS